MKYKPDKYSSHEYEVKNVYMEGTSFKTIVFYLRAGEPVDIKIEECAQEDQHLDGTYQFRTAQGISCFF